LLGKRRSKVRITLSTPATARMSGRYLFQSWVRSSEGAWGDTGIERVGVGGGVRMSKRRAIESEDAVEISVEECGENSAL